MALIDIINKWAIQPEDPNAIPPELLDAVSHESKPVAQPVEAKPSVEQRFTDSDADRKMASRAELETLLKSFDDASSRQRRGNVAAGLSEAGMEFGHAFGGQPVDKNWTQGMRDRAGQEKKDVLDKNKLSLEANKESRDEGDYAQKQMVNIQKMDETGLDIDKKGMGNEQERGLMDKSSPASQAAREFLRESGIQVDDNADARSIVTLFPAAKARIDQIDAVAQRGFTGEQNDKNRRNSQIIESMGNKSREGMNREDNAASIAKEGIRQSGRESIHGLSGANRQMKLQERMIRGFKIADIDNGFIPDAASAKDGKDMSGEFNGIMLVLENVMNQMNKNPRNFPKSKSWNTLESAAATLKQTGNKLNGNGVMNFGDWDNLRQELGDPASWDQNAFNTAREKLGEWKKNSSSKFFQKMGQWGYVPGEMSASDLGQSGVGGGGASQSGPINKMSRDDINTQLGAAGLNPLGNQQQQTQPTQNQSQQTPNIPAPQPTKLEMTDPDGKTRIRWTDGKWRLK